MLQSDYNSNPYQCILYYCNSPAGQNDPTVYDTLLSNVCSLSYDGSGNIAISGWLIGGYGAPSTGTILSYSISDVLTFYNNFYIIPQNILAAQPYTISTSDLNNVVPHSSNPNMLGFLVFDSTVHALKFWNGSSWVVSSSLFLKLDGTSSMGGNLNMNSNNINNVVTVYQSSPSCIGINTSASSSISFTANTPKVVSLGSFSQTVNPNSDFSFNSSTGQITYSGSTTRYFRINIGFSVASLSVASTQTNYISKNGSTTISGANSVNSYLLLGPTDTRSFSLSDIIQLANNDTIQLGAQCSSTQSLTYSNISYSVNAL